MRYALLIALLVSAAAISAQEPARSVRAAVADTVKIGKYDLEITTDDGTMTGELTVTREKDHLNATINAGGRVPQVKSFVKEGSHYVLSGGHNNFLVTYTFSFSRDSVAGSFKMSTGLSGTVVGAYRR